mmetsp:Transcript_15361/g.48395  ORF Transcript_15361/g.48395 Transcript_15361/m.48395 type:complete len:206 (-) Transcript_15361:420-1037(-)
MSDDKDDVPAEVAGEEVPAPDAGGAPEPRPSTSGGDPMRRAKPVPTGPKIDISRAIQDLDKLMHHMKHQRRLCQKSMEEDQKAIEELDKEISSLEPKLGAVDQANAEREQRRKLIQEQVTELDQSFAQLQGNVRSLIRKTSRNTQALNTMTASQRLEATRGFSTRTSTSDLIHRKTPAAAAKPKKKTLPPSKPPSVKGEEEAPKA